MEWTNKREKVAEKKSISQKKVSVIIPVYNTANYLGECLDSLRRQNYKNLEIICVDDGSTDNSANILQYYSKLDPRIKYLRQDNKGQSAARNNGLTAATGDYICFLDSDDLLLDNAIFQCIETFSLHPKVDAVVYNMEMFFPDGHHFPCFTGRLYSNDSPILSSKDTEISVNFTNAAACMLKRKLIFDNGIRFPEGHIYEDWVFMLRVMTLQEFHFFWLDSPLYWYRREFAQTTTSNITSKCLDLFFAYEESDKLLQTHPERRKQVYINDQKIVNESIGFLLSRLYLCNDSELIYEFLGKIASLLQSFPDAYFFQLCNELSPERRYAAHSIFKSYSLKIERDSAVAFFEKLRWNSRGVQLFYWIKRRIRVPISRVKVYAKRITRSILPAYRVASSVREEVEGMMLTVQNMQKTLQDVNKRLSSLKTEGRYEEETK